MSTQHVVVAGAGIVGLSTAWFLQERGVEVTVVDRAGVAGGSSWGNAGWLAPALTTPLPEPAVLRYGLKAVLSPSSPVFVPLRFDAGLIRFLAGFARHSTARRWRRSMTVFAGIGRDGLAAYETLAAGGVAAEVKDADPFLIGLGSDQALRAFTAELHHIEAAGVDVAADVLGGDAARELEPALGPGVAAAVRLHGQRFIDPAAFTHALADAVVARGGKLLEGASADGVRDLGGEVVVRVGAGELRADAVVLATGARLGELARPFGVRRIVQAGRGYSFSVPLEHVPAGPVYFPDVRVACTPLRGRLRVAGTMEFRRPDAPLDPRRVAAIVASARTRLAGVRWDERTDEWVGSRPCTSDGLPLVGPTRSPCVHVAGGHGMWGVALGPLTGRQVAESLVTGARPAGPFAAFDPLR
ncbi:NAD(P)/FAD-dependent oxidoreductase [Jiangella anatolica]|uniref:Amino acid dehydrogenase n=1 Tax=Jiangella anatolica TaxID=2670374 RepID=A0A2W2CNH3_9ACTN|nr:FAD-dependent oxidoreductase [Jiangella anatolica]PZF86746.1 amino acid dehydrogenase [Jiangella anatolica]